MSEGGSINSQAFADALARAKQLAAKLTSGAAAASAAATSPQQSFGLKRSADDFQSEPESKRSAAMSDPFGAQLAAMKSGGGTRTAIPNYPGMGITMGLGIGGSGQNCTEEIHIPDALVGLIIGRGGEQVSKIQGETGCKVQVAPDNGTGKDRSCYLQGTKDSIERAKELVMEIVGSKSHEIGRGGGGMNSGVSDQRPKMNLGIGLGMGGGGGGGGNPAGSTTIEMMIPGAKVGLIIGKGGETIRNLQDKSGTKMYILQENMFEECDKPLRIVGEPDLVEHARQLVLELITDTPPKSDFMKPKSEYGGGGVGGGPHGGGALGFGMETMKFPVPKISVGLIIGKGGDMIKRIQMETGAKVQFDPINSTMGDMDEQLAIITGKPDQLRQAQLRIEELVETALQHGGKQGGGGGGHPGGGGMGDRVPRNNWDGGNRFQDGRGGGGGGRGDFEEERMTVPVNRVGMIIGKGGETIRGINQMSGAHCEIDRSSQGEQDRIFVIRGSRSQIEHAKELILEKVNMQLQGRDNRGGGGYGGGQGEYGGQQQQQWGGNQGGGHGGQQQWGGQAPNQGDPSKMGDQSAQWAAYYAQYYGQAQAQGAQTHGQQDYTQQWIEYLRAQGQHQQADMLEHQAKANKGEGANGAGPQGGAPATANGNGTPAAGGQTMDYSQQWADHYRALGKTSEAEAIEAYIKSQKQGGGAGGQPQGQGGRPGGGPAPGQGYPGAYPNNYGGGGGYGGGPGGYPGYGNPGAGPYPGAQGPGQPKPAGTAPPGTEDK